MFTSEPGINITEPVKLAALTLSETLLCSKLKSVFSELKKLSRKQVSLLCKVYFSVQEPVWLCTLVFLTFCYLRSTKYLLFSCGINIERNDGKKRKMLTTINNNHEVFVASDRYKIPHCFEV